MTSKPRPRAWAPTGVTIKVLRLLLRIQELNGQAKIEIPTAAVACTCPINTIHQAISRLRAQGLPLQTLPPPPWNQHTGGATHYLLPHDALDQADFLLAALLREQVLTTNLLRDQ